MNGARIPPVPTRGDGATPPAHLAVPGRKHTGGKRPYPRTLALSHLRTCVPSYLRTCWAAVLAAGILAACGSARRSEPLVGPLTLEDPRLIRGEQAFAMHCHQCHPRGEAGLGPSLNDKPVPTWLIRFQVRNGLGVMPRFDSAQLPPDELDALILYMVALRRHGR